MKFRTVAATVFAGLALGAGLVLPANAKVMSASYYLGRNFESKPLKTCFSSAAYGTVTADGNQYRGAVWAWKAGSTLNNPTLRVNAYDCKTNKSIKLTKITIEQKWVETTCTVGIEVSAGFPWSVGVASTVTCGKHRAAQRRTTYTKQSWVTQYNSGKPVRFTTPLRATAICFQPTITVTAYRGGKSDTFDMSPSSKACVRP